VQIFGEYFFLGVFVVPPEHADQVWMLKNLAILGSDY
jgi:hypothetical protein